LLITYSHIPPVFNAYVAGDVLSFFAILLGVLGL